MKLTEYVVGSGIYKIRKVLIPEMEQFMRGDDVDGKVQPLLHICERDIEPHGGSYYFIMADKIRWDTMYGHYKCTGCKKTFYTEEQLAQVWADGKGTGAEILC